MWLRAKQLISSCPMLIINSWLPAMLWKPSPRERRIIGSTTLSRNVFKDSLNRQLFWNQSWKCRMQVSEYRVSEKTFSKGGHSPWWIATSLYRHVEKVWQFQLYAYCVRPIGSDTSTIKMSHRALGRSGGWTETRLTFTLSLSRYAKRDTAVHLKGVFTLLESKGISPHREPEQPFLLKCTLKSSH